MSFGPWSSGTPTMPPNWNRFGVNWIRTRQDADLWREEADRERARIANLQADAEHTERDMTRLRTELEQARRPWWRRLIRR